MRKIMLFVLLLPLAFSVSVAADERNSIEPSFALDVLQPGYNLAGTSNQFHLTLVGVNVSLFRVGRLRFPTAGLDFQARCANCTSEYDKALTGHWLVASGIRYVISESSKSSPFADNIDLHIKALYSTREDADPRVGRWGIGVGVSLLF